ncbi:MAG TPA: hypothetical protein VHZ02_14675 [Acidimicrobiales bacterium]|nr:hypothetical protein [Acidimicrobiales bacterium]
MVDLLAPHRPVGESLVGEGTPPAGGEPSPPASPSWWHRRPYPLLGRWLVLIAAVGLAFHQTLASVVVQSANGDPLAYLVLLPVWGLVLVLGTQLRRGRDLDIHDRQVDWVLAVGLTAFIFMLDVLLRPRLGATAGLVRIDVLALVLFVMVGSMLLFGTRATGQSWAAWLFLLACWPLPYRLVGAALGGTSGTYALLNIMATAVAVMVASGPPMRRRLVDGALAVAIGIAVLAVASRALPPVAVQLVPSLVALGAVATIAMGRKRLPLRLPAPSKGARGVVTKPIAAMVAVLVLGAVLGGFAQFAPPTIDPQSLAVAGPGWTSRPVVPAGFATTHARESESWAARYFGAGSTWFRYRFAGGSGVERQHIVVDALTAPSVGQLSVYPAISCYRLSVPYLQSSTTVSLGHGVVATLFYANAYAAPSPVQAQWAMLTWTWKIAEHGTVTFQRVAVWALEDASGVVGFPVPGAPGANNGIRTTFTDILRGASTTSGPGPTRSTVGRLTAFSAQVVARQQARTP